MMKKILSYVYQFVTNKTSVFNGNLKILFQNGKKFLNTKDANYSFASLHRIMRFALEKTAFSGEEDILLLGLGAGSAIDLIRNDFHLKNSITAVDIDPVIIEVAQKEFGLDAYNNTEIICQDAYRFVQKSQRQYGLIIIDLFINNKVPEKFFDIIFWGNVIRILTTDGRIIFNTMAKTTKIELFQNIINRLEQAGFQISVHEKVDGTNKVILATRG